MKNKNIIIGILALALTAALIYIFVFNNNGNVVNSSGSTTTETKSSSGERKVLYWRAPMNPNEVYDKPGKSRMGMDLVPVYEDEGTESGVVKISGTVQQNMNVKTAIVKKRSLRSQVVTNGILNTDERKEYIVTTKVGGWVDKLYVNYTGQKVRKGQRLIDIYSPELVAAQQEYLTALSYSRSVRQSSNKSISESGEELINNSIKKLELLDVSKKEIERLKSSKEIKKYITLYAPFDGTVITKKVIEGERIKPGTPLLKIADLKNLWLDADIYEYELSKIKVGSEADIKFNYLPGKTFKSRVSFIYPTLDAKTRTVKVRIDLPNYKDELKPAMFAAILIHGRDLGIYPVVPEEAIIRSGLKNILILALGDGKFRPVDVELGNYSDGFYQVLSGINEGDKIVISAQFLIDSESSLRAALNQFTGDENSSNDMQDMDNSKSQNDKQRVDDPMIRKGVIDLSAIDENKDGKLYEDVMDWNVISDKPGTCPICGMKLREFTIDEVKANLTEHGFKYKNK